MKIENFKERITMKPYLEDDNRRYHAQSERKKRMRIKKQLQHIFRRFLCCIALGIVMILVVAITVFSQKAEVGEIQSQVQIFGSVDQSEKLAIVEMTETPGYELEIVDSTEYVGNTSEAVDETGDGTGKESQVYEFTSTADTVNITSGEVISSHAILVDESTDTIVALKGGAKERIIPASMTKVLTVLVAAEQITEKNLDDTFTITLDITDYAYVNDCSSVGFLDGETVTVRDLFYGTILPSGGDAAVGLATYIAGSHEAFVDMMNEKLEELGLAETSHFTNCVGLYDENHYSTVYDMAVIMKAAVNNELCKEFLSARRYTTTPTEQHPEGITVSNWFLRRIEDKDTGGEVLCAKTGYVAQSRSCAVSYGTSANGTPYICVTVGSDSSWRCIYDHVEIYNRYVPKVEETSTN